MSTEATLHDGAQAAAIGHDDYSLRRVPQEARYSWVSVAVQRFGMLSALAQFGLAAMIGIHMKFWDAMLAITIGAALLEVVTIFVGIAGMREGLSTSVLSRWSGFGRKGSALTAIFIALSLSGWFGFQNQIFGVGLKMIFGGPEWIWCILGGIVVTFIVVYGFRFMNYVAWVTVPAFLLLATFTLTKALGSHDLGKLTSNPPVLAEWPLAQGVTLVAGGFIVGAIFTPDMSRFNRSVGDVVKQTLVGVTLGEYYVGVIAVLLAHTLTTGDIDKMLEGMGPGAGPEQATAGLVINLITGGSVLGVLILCASIVKINDWNLYPSSLGVVNGIEGLFGFKLNRTYVALALGALGTFFSAIGIATKFEQFLAAMSVVFLPIAAIMIADYFVLRTWRNALDEAKAQNDGLPSEAPEWVWPGLVAWACGTLWGYFGGTGFEQHLCTDQGCGVWPMNINYLGFLVPSIMSFVVTFIVYVILGKLGFVKGPQNPGHITAKETV